jgi:hypothetical protein
MIHGYLRALAKTGNEEQLGFTVTHVKVDATQQQLSLIWIMQMTLP